MGGLLAFFKTLYMTTWTTFAVPLLVQMLPIINNRLATQMSHDFNYNVQDHIAL